ncbi:MAG: ATP-binding cassette domain-containing protein [Nitrospirales bacterium]|nr:ATP-binding cassette domain-containing protein [Nitrospirales bacterium]
MSLLSLRDIRLAFGGPELLDGVSLQIEPGERVCLVGRNGAGKSSLMRIITGEMTPDSGEVIRQQGVTIASLSQVVPRNLSGTVFEVVAGGLGGMVDLLSDYHNLSNRLSHNGDEALLSELERVQHQIETSGGWQMQQQVDTVITRLGLDPDADVSGLSGGTTRRVLLGRALVSHPDLLLLDEPTNHLDISSISWLEEFLLDFPGSILFITHDRRFLQTLATRIIELDRGRVSDWPGNYTTYLERRQAQLDAEATQNALFDKKLAQEEAWVRQGIKARRTRNEGRVRALKEMRKERRARRELTGSVSMKLNEAERSGKIVFEAETACFSYEGKTVIQDFSSTITKGDKIGIIGPNGSGKTTLLNIILGSLEPQTGSVRRGTNLQVAYFDQHRMQLDDERSVADNVADGNQYVTINGKTQHIMGYLADFLFPADRARSPIKVLSGGERNRALLAKLFTQPSNVLVMDEPTNDLDTDTLDLLEELLQEYDGTVLLVSHDREFLNNVVTSTIAFDTDGRFREYVGGYDDWLMQRPSETVIKKEKTVKQERPRTQKEKPRTLSFKEKKELEALPGLIESLETERETLFVFLGNPDSYKEDPAKITAAKARIEELEPEIATAYERWETLEAIANAV